MFFRGCPEATAEDEERESRNDGRERPVPRKNYLIIVYVRV